MLRILKEVYHGPRLTAKDHRQIESELRSESLNFYSDFRLQTQETGVQQTQPGRASDIESVRALEKARRQRRDQREVEMIAEGPSGLVRTPFPIPCPIDQGPEISLPQD